MRKSTSGFTLVELLIVIVIIAILAAITIVSYRGIQDRANDAAIQNDLASYAKKAEMYHIEEGVYPTTAATDMKSLNQKASQKSYYSNNYNLYYATTASRDIFAFAARSKSGKLFYASSHGSGNLGDRNMTAAAVYEVLDADASSGRNLTYGYNNETKTWASWTE